MHYYYHNIKDFRAGCHNLESRLDRWIYRDMIEAYYDREQPFPDSLDQICDMLGLRRENEREIVSGLLLLKFQLSERGWSHERCDEELAKYHANAEIARANGAKGGRPTGSGKKPSGFQDGSDPVANGNPSAPTPKANQKPITRNQKPVTKEKKSAPPPGDAALFPDVDPQVVADFKAVRTKKRAPITATAMRDIAKQAEIAGMTLEAALRICCSRGWAGFEAEWVARKEIRAGPSASQSRHNNFENIDYSEGSEDGKV